MTTMTKRVFNFSAGPATLPQSVLEEAQANLLSFGDTGVGICEISHRSPEYDEVHMGAQARLRSLLGLDDDWAVLFLQGGASSQFYQIPMNLGVNADYLVTGAWAKKAHKEAAMLGDARVAASSEETVFNFIPKTLETRGDASYLHVTSNNTIYGTQVHDWPDSGSAPLVADMSSDILSRPLPVDRFGLIYAGAQKNLGPSGVTVVLIRNELLERSPSTIPTMINYNTHASKHSLYNTPPTFPIYIVSLVLKWIEQSGGLAAMAERNAAKAGRLYQVIDDAPLYAGHSAVEDRSAMNVAFTLANPDLGGAFLAEAKEEGLVGLKGHRSVGGMRASIYNAMPAEGVETLARFMEGFAARNG